MQHTLNEHPPPGIQIQAMPLKVGNVSLCVVFCWSVIFSFLFVWPYFSDKSLSIPKTQDVRIGKVIHWYPVRMLNPPSVVWLDRIRNMALVVQITRHFQIMKLDTLSSQNCTIALRIGRGAMFVHLGTNLLLPIHYFYGDPINGNLKPISTS